jgi:uncharacterized membrane protein (UPF0127 family)
MKFRSEGAAVSTAILITALAAPVFALPLPGPSSCPPQPVKSTVAVRAPATTLQLRIADTSDTRSYGLMCVLGLPEHTGMIFVFSGGDVTRNFWMKNTLIPLDMVWVTAGGKVTTVAANVPSTTVQTPDADIPNRSGVGTYVIELAAGEAARDGIKPGVRLDLSHVARAKD